MSDKVKDQAIIIRQEEIATDIYSMWLRTEQTAKKAQPGQFVALYCEDGSRILPRPISICEVDRADDSIRLVYRIAGKGTDEFSRFHTGKQLELLGPLGNGYPKKKKKAMLLLERNLYPW